MFFNDWTGLLRIVIVGILAYLALVLLLHISGKRTLSKMNAFDLIVTVALGSTLATVSLSRNTALAEDIASFALLIGLQYIITWLSVRSRRRALARHAEHGNCRRRYTGNRWQPDRPAKSGRSGAYITKKCLAARRMSGSAI